MMYQNICVVQTCIILTNALNGDRGERGVMGGGVYAFEGQIYTPRVFVTGFIVFSVFVCCINTE
jgi:hypothetical protein